MMRRFIALVLLTVMMLLSSCLEGTGTAARNGREAGSRETPDDWVTIGGKYPYKSLSNLHPFKVPEIKIDAEMASGQGKLETCNDGFVCVSVKPVSQDVEAAELKKPLARKYDNTGKLLWEKEYEYSSSTGFINNLVICADNGFLYTIQTYPQYSADGVIYEKSLIIRCGENGDMLWKHELDDYSGNMVMTAILAEDGEVWLIGTGRMKNGVQTKEEIPDTIAVTRLDADGNPVGQNWFGGNDFDYVYSAYYNKASGLILWGSSQSRDGDFAIDKDSNRNDFIACMNNRLELQWIHHAGMNKGYDTAPLISDNGEVYILGSMYEAGSKPKGFLSKLDREGSIVWEKQVFGDYWGNSVSQAVNGDILIAKGYSDTGMIAVVDSDGNEKKLFDGLEFNPGEIYPVESGGFIVTATRNVGYVPQPPFISSIWYDTELVVIKYNSEYEIEWRKTYDRYQNQRGMDLAWPQPDGSLVIPR